MRITWLFGVYKQTIITDYIHIYITGYSMVYYREYNYHLGYIIGCFGVYRRLYYIVIQGFIIND